MKCNRKYIEKNFVERTRYHQYLVKKNLLLMTGYFNLSKKTLLNTAIQHDESKFKEPERTAYMWMNWGFYCKKNHIDFPFSNDIKNVIALGHQHHISNNLHHPEAHQNINHMRIIDIVEMVCDWTAISEELGVKHGSCLGWVRHEIDKKWQFSTEMKDFIFTTIHELNKRRQ
jgi:hypothetical protein